MTTTKDVAIDIDLAVRRLIARYSQLEDDGHHVAVGELFVEDGRLRVNGKDLRGRTGIVEFLGSVRGDTSHAVTNVVVSKASQEGAYHAVSDLTLSMRGDDGKWSVLALGRYHDTVVGEGHDMRFSQRILTLR